MPAMEEEREPEAPVRVRLVFGGRDLLTEEQRSEGLGRSWAAIRPEHATVADFARDVIGRFGLGSTAVHGLVLSMDGFVLPAFESTSVFRDNDVLRVKNKVNNKKKTIVAVPDEDLQIEGNEIIDKQTVLPDDGHLFLQNGENGSNNRSNNNKRVLTEVTGTKRKHKEMEGPENSKYSDHVSLSQSDGQNGRNSQLRTSNSVSTDEEDDIDFESLNPLTCLPTEGDIIAYRLVETSSGGPQLSVFRVGKVIKFDPLTMLILLGPVPQYPIFLDCEISKSQKSMYKEDGTLEIDFGSLVDLRLVEESEPGKAWDKSKVITWQNGSGFHKGADNNVCSTWKAANEETRTDRGAWTPNNSRGASCQGMGQRGRRIQSRGGYRGRNGGMHKNVNSYWQAGEEEYGHRTCTVNSRYGEPNPRWGQNGNRFDSYDGFSRRMNERAGNNDNSAWEANCEATNADDTPQTQENGWDTWAPNTSRTGSSWSRMGQNNSGFGSTSGISNARRKGRGGRYPNSKFCK